MATMDQRIIALAQAIGSDVALINANIGNKSLLTTTAKTSLVAAINELKANAGESSGNAGINDAASATDTTYSSSKVEQLISALKAEIMGGTPNAAYDTLKEIADYIEGDQTGAAAMTAAINKRVRYDAAQNLTTEEKLQACNNIGVGNPDTDFVTTYTNTKNAA